MEAKSGSMTGNRIRPQLTHNATLSSGKLNSRTLQSYSTATEVKAVGASICANTYMSASGVFITQSKEQEQ